MLKFIPIMAKIQPLFALLALTSLAKSSLALFGSGSDAYTRSISAPQGSFATPNHLSKETLSDNPDDISFLLYSNPRSPNVYEVIVHEDPHSLASMSNWKPLKILIHGFLQNATTNFPRVIKDSYFKSFGAAYSIMVMDWGRLATPNAELPGAIAHYPSAVKNVQTAGVRLGQFLAWLIKNNAIDYTHTHLVGHGLGAHVAGWAGETLNKLAGDRVARLSALDPAGPLFELGLAGRTVRKNDAQYVDSYHTGRGGLGIGRDNGDADFWINGGGPIQPGCGLNIGGFCTHWRSIEYWRQSIENSTNVGRLCACRRPFSLSTVSNCCEEMVEFGEAATPKTKGTYYVNI